MHITLFRPADLKASKVKFSAPWAKVQYHARGQNSIRGQKVIFWEIWENGRIGEIFTAEPRFLFCYMRLTYEAWTEAKLWGFSIAEVQRNFDLGISVLAIVQPFAKSSIQ